MCFPRKASLGRYNGSRVEWASAYRSARVKARNGGEPDPETDGIVWKAALIVAFERHDHNDCLTYSIGTRLATKRLIDEITSE